MSVNPFLRLINARAGMMLRMIRATAPGSPAARRRDGAFRRCLACREERACRLWLDLPRTRPAAPPAFCANAHAFAEPGPEHAAAPPAGCEGRRGRVSDP